MPTSSRRGFLAASAGLISTPITTLAAPAATATFRDADMTPISPDWYRPVLHYSPARGFMNDPNGLIWLDGRYHLFYQYNPAAAEPGNVHWGHASSPDLIRWQEHAPALFPDARGQVYSGSAVWDRDNTSGLFDHPAGGLVAIFTRAGARQTQDLAYGPIDGSQLTPYAGNPVLDIDAAGFRDPKVFWHAPTARWIMAVAMARQHEISFYASTDLKQWHLVGTFGMTGLLGLDYECPDLVELPLEGGGSRWVLFVSLNPGAPVGGSAVQYFVGHFDGQAFHAEDSAARLLDAGQDFYALQTFSHAPDGPVGIAWMNNWLYCDQIPATPARGVMSLPRRLSLRRREDHWYVVQRFPDLSAWQTGMGAEQSWARTHGTVASLVWPSEHAMEILAEGELTPGSRLRILVFNPQGEVLEAGLDLGRYPSWYMSRAQQQGFDHPCWQHKAITSVLHDFQRFDCHVVIDRNTIELLSMDGQIALSLLHFFRSPPTRVEIKVEHGEWHHGQLRTRALTG